MELRDWLVENRLTVMELARDSGVHRTAIRRIKQGKREPTFGTATRLSLAMGVDLDEQINRARSFALHHFNHLRYVRKRGPGRGVQYHRLRWQSM